jgi:DNA-binding MarR family transcriptional regulator
VQSSQPSNSQRFLKGFWNLRQRLFREVGGKLKSAHGLELSHMQVLRYISQSELTPTELAEEMQLPTHGISRILESLERQDLLERTLNPNDARKRVLTLTKKGEIILKRSHAVIDTELNTILSALKPNDLEQLLKYLDMLSKEQA